MDGGSDKDFFVSVDEFDLLFLVDLGVGVRDEADEDVEGGEGLRACMRAANALFDEGVVLSE